MEHSEKKTSYTRSHAREAALSGLYQVEIAKISKAKALEDVLSREAYPSSISRFIKELLENTWDHKDEIDEIIIEYIRRNDWDFSRLAVLDRNILRLALYEIKHIEAIPPKVTISEYVSLANKFCTPEQGRFIHGVLGQYLKKIESSLPKD